MWQDNVNFEDDGIQIEPFNLKQEREEGYFDANGNFVEYTRQNEIKVFPLLFLFALFFPFHLFFPILSVLLPSFSHHFYYHTHSRARV